MKTTKKIIGVMLALSMFFASLAVMSSAAINPKKLTVADARAVLRAAVGIQPLSAADKKTGDIDFDSKITVSDARTVLRIAVGLDVIDGKSYNNEYELLTSGHYSFTGTYTEKDSKSQTVGKVSLVVTASSVKMDIAGVLAAAGGDMDELNDIFALLGDENFQLSSILFANGKISMVSDNSMEAISFSESVMGDEFSAMRDELKNFIPALHTSLSQASSTRKESFGGKSCTVYVFAEKDSSGVSYTSNVFMDGNKLVKIDYANSKGVVFRSISFDSFSRVVASTDMSLNGYTVYDIKL